MKLHVFMAAVGVVGLLSACAQQEEVTMVKPQPTFDKFGNGSCDEGLIYVPGADVIDPCIPEDECEPVYDSAGNVLECLPIFEVQEDNGSGTTGRSPTGAAGGP
ncbi:MAG: hypothetical protein ABJF50_11880 [Paracoccaceae bacterium]